jgi:hypothetical protein
MEELLVVLAGMVIGLVCVIDAWMPTNQVRITPAGEEPAV